MDAILQQVAQGFRGLPVTDDARQTAAHHIAQWLTETSVLAYRPQLEWLIAQQQWSLLLDSFTGCCRLARGDGADPWALGRIALMSGPWPLRCKAMSCTCGSATRTRISP